MKDMKKIIHTFCFLAAGAGLAGCSLDLEPKAGVTFEHFFRNENDLYATVAEMHGTLRESLCAVSFQDHMGVNIDWIAPGSNSYQQLRELDPNRITDITSQQQWKRYYNILTLTDLFMDNYHKAEGVEPSRLNFCLGQCYFMRSVCYLWLGRTWGDAVITKGSLYSDKYAKSPAKMVIDTAISAGLKAYELLPKHADMKGAGGRALTSKQYGCKGSVAAVLAHLYAWKGSVFNDRDALVEAEKWATKLADKQYAAEVGDYTLAADPEAVCEKTMVRGDAESIFELHIDFFESDPATFLAASYLLNYPLKRNSVPEDVSKGVYGIKLETVNAIYKNGDLRRKSYFYTEGSVPVKNSDGTVKDPGLPNSQGLAYIYKWRKLLYRESGGAEPAQFRNLDCNKVLIRLADIILLRAECRVKLGDMTGAASDLNAIRGRAGADLYPAAGENAGDLQLLIFREREKELLLEDGRYYDVVRNGNDYVRRELNGAFRDLTDADIRNGALYLPVPQPAFRDNDLMIQNTYWLSKTN